MDETEKYRQRLEAIAEKRRLQEEQDRAKREMEDERLRLQQLKRKSLRDQWLMEGAPLSPTSLNTLSSHSPLWSFQAQEMNQDMEKLQSESQQLAEEKKKFMAQMEVGQMKTETLADDEEARKEIAQEDIVQNGENNASASESHEDQVRTNQHPLLNETAFLLTNGSEDVKENGNLNYSVPSTQSITNGPVCTTEGVGSMKSEPGLSLGVSEAEPGQSVNINEEAEEETVVMRAECVIITDEGEDVSENLPPQEVQQETKQLEKIALPKPEESKQEEEPVEGILKTEVLEMFTQPENSEATEGKIVAQPVIVDIDVEGCKNTNENADGETKVEEQDKQLNPTFLQMQSTADAQEIALVAPVPVYSENHPSPLSPETAREAAVSPVGSEPVMKVQDPSIMLDQFQEVPLTDLQQNQKMEVGAGEQEPLLLQSKAHNTQAAPEAANSPSSTETRCSAGAVQGEETKAPNRKSCQCCSIM